MSAVSTRRRLSELPARGAPQVPLDEASMLVGVSLATLERKQRSGRIGPWLERRPRGRQTLVDLDDVVVRAKNITAGEDSDLRAMLPFSPPQTIIAELCMMIESSCDAVAVADRRVAAADAEIARLRERVRELETWLEKSAQFDQVEHVQLGRVLALASAEREEQRLPRLISMRLLATVVYVAAVGGFVWVTLVSHL